LKNQTAPDKISLSFPIDQRDLKNGFRGAPTKIKNKGNLNHQGDQVHQERIKCD
jgi:hypothetical protein